MDTLYVNNDHVVEIQALRDDDGKLISGATAEATLYYADGTTEVPGVNWPLTLAYTGSRGTYRGELPSTVEVTDGSRYRLKLTASYVGKRFEVVRTVRAEERYA